VENNHARSVERIIAILKGFSLKSSSLRLSEIYSRVGIPKSTTHRILATLTKGGLLDYDPEEEKYSVGLELYAIGSLFLSNTDIIGAAEPVVKVLNDLTGEVTNLAIMDDKANIIIILREEVKHALRVGLPVGFSSPAYAHALGKALLSELSDAEIDSLYPNEDLTPLTPKTVPTKTRLKQELEQVRITGVAYISEQAFEGVEAVAAVVRNQAGKAVAATAIGAPTVRMNESRRKTFSAMVKLGAALISYRLGYQGPDVSVRNIEDLRSVRERLNT